MATDKTKQEKELTVEERLKALYALQTILSEVDRIKTLRGELPLEVQDLEDEVAGLETRIQNYKNDIDALLNGINMKNREIAEAKSLIERYTSQLDNVRNNREYDHLSKEIEYQNLNIELANKRINEFNQQIEASQIVQELLDIRFCRRLVNLILVHQRRNQGLLRMLILELFEQKLSDFV